MAEQKRGTPRGGGGRSRRAGPYDQVAIQASARPLQQLSTQQAFGNLSAFAPNSNGTPLVDSLKKPLDRRYYGTGRTQQKFGQGSTSRIPLVGEFHAFINGQAGGQVPSDPNMFVSVDSQTGGVGEQQLGSEAWAQAIASGENADLGVGYVGRTKVGSQGFVNKLRRGEFGPNEGKAVALAMALGGPAVRDNLLSAGYQASMNGDNVQYVKGNSSMVKEMAPKSANKRILGTYGFAMRANQQADYIVGQSQGDNAAKAQLAETLRQNRNAAGFLNPGTVAWNPDQYSRNTRSGKGYRTGMVFTPRDDTGAPLPVGRGADMYSTAHSCKIENSGPGISDYTDNQGQRSAGFRLFKRRNKGANSVSCSYTPDIFVNTVTSSYASNGSIPAAKAIGGNSLRQELDRRGAGALGPQLDAGYADLQNNRDQYFERSLKRRPAAGAATISQEATGLDKVLAWNDRRNGGGL